MQLPENPAADAPLVASLERRTRRLAWGFTATTLLAVALLGERLVARAEPPTLQAVSEDAVLRVRGLVVVDANGIERVRIEAPFIEPLLFGKRYRRLGDMSGILMFDGDGNERSGYGTADELGPVLFTLDTLEGDAAHFTAEAEGGVSLWMAQPGGNRLDLAVDGAGPRVDLTRGRKKVAQLPAEEAAAKPEGDR